MDAVVALVDDLMFLSRIREAAKGRGLEVKAARTAADALAAARDGARLVIMDLDSPRLGTADALSGLRSDPALTALPVVGFFSHVDAQRGRDAAQAGCTTVLPRSAFVQKLDALLAEAAAVSGGGREPGTGA
jgi:CheY-like chemotaxis protein